MNRQTLNSTPLELPSLRSGHLTMAKKTKQAKDIQKYLKK